MGLCPSDVAKFMEDKLFNHVKIISTDYGGSYKVVGVKHRSSWQFYIKEERYEFGECQYKSPIILHGPYNQMTTYSRKFNLHGLNEAYNEMLKIVFRHKCDRLEELNCDIKLLSEEILNEKII